MSVSSATSPASSALDVRALEAHRAALTGHCYRMLGSVVEADDAVQETMIRAWKALAGFDGRSSLRTWLTRIATNVCLDALSDAKRRARPMEEGPSGTIEDELVSRPRTHWLEPVPDARAIPAEDDPAARALQRESIRLAFVAACQLLPPKQRAALLLTEVIGCSAAEVAETLELSVASVNSALQRARATLAERGEDAVLQPKVPSPEEEELVVRYVEAFERYDADTLASLCREDVTFSMPPYALWLVGPEKVRGWLLGRGCGCRGSRLVRTSASGTVAFGQYRPAPSGEGHVAWGLVVLETEGGLVRRWNTFLDVETLFPRFDLPMTLPPA